MILEMNKNQIEGIKMFSSSLLQTIVRHGEKNTGAITLNMTELSYILVLHFVHCFRTRVPITGRRNE